MTDHERDRTIDITADRLYAYLSDVANLPRYFTQMRTAELVADDEVHTRAVIDVPGQESQEVEGTAWFRRDLQTRQIEWGSEGENDYRGRVQVHEASETSSRVVLEIHTESGHGGIEDAIDETLAALEHAARAESP